MGGVLRLVCVAELQLDPQGAGGCSCGGADSVDAPISSASSSRSSTTPAGVLCFLGSASSDEGWLG